jgi:hypothetical protein
MEVGKQYNKPGDDGGTAGYEGEFTLFLCT